MSTSPDLTTTAGKIADLAERLAQSQAPLGDAAATAPSAGTLSARQRVVALVDEGSFVETDALARHRSTAFGREHDRPYTDGVITGYATVHGAKVCVISHDAAIFQGTIGEVYADKVAKTYELALKTGVPLVTLAHTTGPRIQEGVISLSGIAKLAALATKASGLVPQLTVIHGEVSGPAAAVVAQSDIIIATGEHGTQFQPQLRAATDAEALSLARTVLHYLPVNNRAEAPRTEVDITVGSVADNITAADRELDTLISETSSSYQVRDIITHLADDGEVLELGADSAAGVLTALTRIEGRAVGIIATDSAAGTLGDAECAQAAAFIRLCDSFNTPLITLVDSANAEPSPARAAQLAFAYAEASVGTMTIYTRHAVGSSYVLLGPKALGADIAYAWPTAAIAVAVPQDAAAAIYGADSNAQHTAELAEEFFHPYAAAEFGLVDAVIEPAATRGLIIEGMRLLERKVYHPEFKKHGNIRLS